MKRSEIKMDAHIAKKFIKEEIVIKTKAYGKLIQLNRISKYLANQRIVILQHYLEILDIMLAEGVTFEELKLSIGEPALLPEQQQLPLAEEG